MAVVDWANMPESTLENVILFHQLTLLLLATLLVVS